MSLNVKILYSFAKKNAISRIMSLNVKIFPKKQVTYKKFFGFHRKFVCTVAGPDPDPGEKFNAETDLQHCIGVSSWCWLNAA
jgi:hypothetical protein